MIQKYLNRSSLKELKEDHLGTYDEDEKYLFTNEVYFIPNAIRPFFGLKRIRRDRRSKRYGRIKGHVFNYITTPMVLITSGLLYFIAQKIPTLLVFFNTNIYLNGLIVSLMIFGILRVFFNSYLLFRAASFLRDLEKIEYVENITEKHIYKLRRGLERKGELLNTIYMVEVINHIDEKGFLNITDNQARFIKSKLGQRAARNRQGVNFISGVLVMLGLLGTFLGLLGTIDSVGTALNSMANIGGENGEIGMKEMTGFIGSLAAPLQGMGLAFSSSLFGLSGSLLIGFYLHLAGTPQNFFIENVSRWIDEHIKRFNPKDLAAKAKDEKTVEKAKAEQKAHATDQDLKDWLTGYVYLSTKTHKMLLGLTETIEKAGTGIRTEVHDVSAKMTDVVEQQQGMTKSVSDIGKNTHDTASSMKEVQLSVKDMQDLSHVMNTSLTSIDVTSQSLSKEMPKITATVQSVSKDLPKVTESIEALKGLLAQGQKQDEKNHKELGDNIVNALGSLKEETSRIVALGESAQGHITQNVELVDAMKIQMRKYAYALYKELKKANEYQVEDLKKAEQLVEHLANMKAYISKIEGLSNTSNHSGEEQSEATQSKKGFGSFLGKNKPQD